MKIVLKEILNSISLSGALIFCIYKVIKAIIIYKNKHFGFAIF